ncbi:hypothetical protein N7474_009055 [Penicillium riverlandense]|uniref:uncharacterized protein n=1 Tax=Penicillium riverlandense TaxID=1903569 RepID=UPI0025490163|nr:uncharacterized protein N7474_009055 [Penicillium riverlandense]KAJ5807786.1 hypothetical protein N7474_009055 [Penicillium riverlandense]
MRNSEESSSTNPLLVLNQGPVLPVRAWCETQTTALTGLGAKIVCDATLVQYAAYLLFLCLDFGMEELGIIRFRLFGWGWRFTFFSLRSVCSLFFSVPRSVTRAVLERSAFCGNSANWQGCRPYSLRSF